MKVDHKFSSFRFKNPIVSKFVVRLFGSKFDVDKYFLINHVASFANYFKDGTQYAQSF